MPKMVRGGKAISYKNGIAGFAGFLVSRDTCDTCDTNAIPKIISYKKRIGIAGIAAIHQYYIQILSILSDIVSLQKLSQRHVLLKHYGILELAVHMLLEHVKN